MGLELKTIIGFIAIMCLVRSGTCLKGKYPFVKEASARDAETKEHYDYIIVGGGTAGCPLAATLSRNMSVLLLERGGSPYGNMNISRMENYVKSLMDAKSPGSPSQAFVSEEGVISARARVLGGGSCLNAGFYTRARPQEVRAFGWDARLVESSYRWVERIVAHKPSPKQWQSAVRDGLLEVGISPDNGVTYDHLYGTKVGGSIFDDKGFRSTAADLLLYANPHKLTVLLHATVHRVLFSSQENSKRPKAKGVIFKDANGVEKIAYGSEVIISAGSMGSPQLLMLSGVGPAAELQSLGIPMVLDQPSVGGGMADNPMNAIAIPSPTPVEVSLIQVVGITKFGSYIEASSGFGTAAPITSMTSAVKAPNGGFQGGYILEKVMGPLSRGRLGLRNRNVEENPWVRFNYFHHPLDLKRCVQGLKVIQKVIKSHSFRNFTYPNLSIAQLRNLTAQVPINLIPKHSNDSTSLEQFCKDTVTTIWHYHGGCQVGRVVDKNYNVLGVDALRVIDGSTFLFSPGTNPQATVMMLGRYMGVRILRERLGATAGV
eukprot:Gb_33524 [translate_table: standard]